MFNVFKLADIFRALKAALAGHDFVSALGVLADLLDGLGKPDAAAKVRAESEGLSQADARAIAVPLLGLVGDALGGVFGFAPITVSATAGGQGHDAHAADFGHFAACCEAADATTTKAMAAAAAGPDDAKAIPPEVWGILASVIQALVTRWLSRQPAPAAA